MQEEEKQEELVLFASQICWENTVKGSQRTSRPYRDDIFGASVELVWNVLAIDTVYSVQNLL